MKIFTVDTKKTNKGRVISLTILNKPNKRKVTRPEPDLSFAQIIGFDKTDGFFQETKVSVGKL